MSSDVCVLTDISEHCAQSAIIATNTLRLDVSAIADQVALKEVAALLLLQLSHFTHSSWKAYLTL